LIKICGGARIREDDLLGEYERIRDGDTKGGHHSIHGGKKPVWRKGGQLLQFNRIQITLKKTVGQWIVRKGSLDSLEEQEKDLKEQHKDTPLMRRPGRIDDMAPPKGMVPWQMYQPKSHQWKERRFDFHCLDGS
jgi:hypothetical protein